MYRVVGGWSAEMTGAVLARHELSHVLMAFTKAGWLVGLLAWQVEHLVDSTAQGGRGVCFEFTIS